MPETRTLVIFNRRKEFVGFFESLIIHIVILSLNLEEFNFGSD